MYPRPTSRRDRRSTIEGQVVCRHPGRGGTTCTSIRFNLRICDLSLDNHGPHSRKHLHLLTAPNPDRLGAALNWQQTAPAPRRRLGSPDDLQRVHRPLTGARDRYHSNTAKPPHPAARRNGSSPTRCRTRRTASPNSVMLPDTQGSRRATRPPLWHLDHNHKQPVQVSLLRHGRHVRALPHLPCRTLISATGRTPAGAAALVLKDISARVLRGLR